jgi:molybdenum cofactor biosynthesis enzyme MoaA
MFRITTVCNKNCPTCCCDKKKEVLDPEKFRKKLKEISRFFGENADNLNIFLTGGEPFLYKWSKNGETWNIASLTNMIRTIIPNSNIIIKTSGWDEHNFLDNELSTIE